MRLRKFLANTKVTNRKNDKRGVTLIQIFFAIVIIIALTVVFNNFDLFTKSNQGRKTASWVTNLNNLTNSFTSSKDKDNALFTVTIASDDPYQATTAGPAVNAYTPVGELVIEGDAYAATPVITRSLKYDRTGSITFTTAAGATALTAATMSNYKNTPTPVATPLIMKGFVHEGSAGFAGFINKDLTNVEDDLIMGLLNQEKTKVGTQLSKTKTVTGLTGTPTAKDILNVTFGNDTIFQYGDDKISRLVQMNLIDSKALNKLTGINSRFLEGSKYRLYTVTKIASKDEAFMLFDKKLATHSDPNATGNVPEDTKIVEEYYDNMVKNIQENLIVVMPMDKAEVVYSESSDFKRMKFSNVD